MNHLHMPSVCLTAAVSAVLFLAAGACLADLVDKQLRISPASRAKHEDSTDGVNSAEAVRPADQVRKHGYRKRHGEHCYYNKDGPAPDVVKPRDGLRQKCRQTKPHNPNDQRDEPPATPNLRGTWAAQGDWESTAFVDLEW
jgi:hypothetical protein